MAHFVLKVNGLKHRVTALPDTPLLYVLRNELRLHGPRFGCGLAQCGACTVLLDQGTVRSCVTPVAAVADTPITTVEGLGSLGKPGPVQQAFIDAQAAQCGYCTSGMIVAATYLLKQKPNPSPEEIRAEMTPWLCRCGTHFRIIEAIQDAATAMAA